MERFLFSLFSSIKIGIPTSFIQLSIKFNQSNNNIHTSNELNNTNINGKTIVPENNNKDKEDLFGLIGKLNSDEVKILINEVLNPIGYNLMVTPKDVDTIIESLSKIIANGINIAIQPNMDMEEINKFMN